ncbi:DUF5134 domain-containing protein [Mycolicibacterium sp. Y3]
MTMPAWLCFALSAVFVAAAAGYLVPLHAGVDRWRRCVGLAHGLSAVVMTAMLWPVGMAVCALVYLLFFTALALLLAYVGLFERTVSSWPVHAAMFSAMAVMPVIMTTPTPAPVMPSMSGHAMASAPMASVELPTWLEVSAVVLASASFAGALWWFYAAVRGPERPWPDALMALGMGTCFALGA